MLQISEKDRDIVQRFILGAHSSTHTVQQAVNLINILGGLEPVKDKNPVEPEKE